MPGHDVRRVIFAEGISNFGSMLGRLAIPWIATVALSATAAQMAALVAADLLVSALGALWLGPRIDRSSKPRVMRVCDGLRAVGFGLIGTSYMVYVSRDLALPTGPQGLLFALGALGALLGAALAPQWQPRRALVWGLALAALASWCVPMAQGAGIATMALIAAQQIIGDAGDTLYDVHDQTLRQTAAPADQRARVDAGIRGIGQLGTLLGAAVGAIVGTVHSPRAALLCGALATTAALMVAAARLSRHERCA